MGGVSVSSGGVSLWVPLILLYIWPFRDLRNRSFSFQLIVLMQARTLDTLIAWHEAFGISL